MTTNKATHIKQLGKAVLALLVAAAPLTSCDDQIFDYEGDCTIRIKFKYDYNMKYADAFAHEVDAVNLFVFDSNTGLLVQKLHETGDSLTHADYEVKLELEAGRYDLLAWCGSGITDERFTLPATKVGETTMEEVSCYMERVSNGDHPSCITEDVGRLFHGMKHISFSAKELGDRVDTISLTKNTNSVRIVLQHLEPGEDLAPYQYDFRIVDNNGMMAYDNSICSADTITYHPWDVQAIEADIDAEIGGGHQAPGTRAEAVASMTATMAEFTLSRLMADKEPTVMVFNKETGEKIISIPLNDYALMVKGYYNSRMGDQEYLDRQDEYTLTFFLSHGRWLTSVVYINDWRVVLQHAELQ